MIMWQRKEGTEVPSLLLPGCSARAIYYPGLSYTTNSEIQRLRNMKDPIHLCDVVLFDGKTKREYKLRDVVLAGNDRKKIWASPTHKKRLVTLAFKTKSRIQKQMENPRLYIQSIQYNVYLGDSNYKWGLSS